MAHWALWFTIISLLISWVHSLFTFIYHHLPIAIFFTVDYWWWFSSSQTLRLPEADEGDWWPPFSHLCLPGVGGPMIFILAETLVEGDVMTRNGSGNYHNTDIKIYIYNYMYMYIYYIILKQHEYFYDFTKALRRAVERFVGHLGGSINGGSPKWRVYNGKSYENGMIWGYLHFRKHP